MPEPPVGHDPNVTASSPAPRTRRRRVSALGFGLWGTVASACMYLGPASDRGPGEVVLFIILPGAAAAVSGAVVGPTLLDPNRRGAWRSAGLGILATLLAYLVFAPLFALGWWVVDPEGLEISGLMLATPTIGLVMTAPLTLPAGALAGWSIYALRTVLDL